MAVGLNIVPWWVTLTLRAHGHNVQVQDSPLLSFFAKILPPHGRVCPSNSRPAARKERGATTGTLELLCLLHVWVCICTENMICLDFYSTYRSSWALPTSSRIRAVAALVGVRGGCFRRVVAPKPCGGIQGLHDVEQQVIGAVRVARGREAQQYQR